MDPSFRLFDSIQSLGMYVMPYPFPIFLSVRVFRTILYSSLLGIIQCIYLNFTVYTQ